MPITATSHAYLPDGICDTPQPQTPYPLWLTLAIFVGVFAVLQWAWGEARDTWVERLVIHQATVKPATALIQIVTPDANARPVAASIKAPGGGLNILNGCEGTEVMFLLIAAFAAVRLNWRQKMIGLQRCHLHPPQHRRLPFTLVMKWNNASSFNRFTRTWVGVWAINGMGLQGDDFFAPTQTSINEAHLDYSHQRAA